MYAIVASLEEVIFESVISKEILLQLTNVFIIDYFVDYFYLVHKTVKNVDQCYPKLKMMHSKVLICPKPKYTLLS